jgi:DMSO reductase family type II enzyme chaperone
MGRGGGGKQMIELIYLYKILSLGFSYPEKETWAMIAKQFTMCEGFFEGDLLSDLNGLKTYYSENGQRIDHIKSEYVSIFDIGRKISPYETEYISEKVSRKPFELADIAGFYQAFGFSVSEDLKNKEALDHISVELEFMAILSWKEEYAKETKQDDNLRVVQDARGKFFKEHLAKWGFFFCRQIDELEGDGLYKMLSQLLERILVLECNRYSLDVSMFKRQMNRDLYDGVRGEELTCLNP